MAVIFWLFLMIAVFWSGFEQAGTSLNLFARDLTDRTIFGWELPASTLQSVNAGFIILLAPIFGMLWVWLDSRQVNPSIPVKAGLGLLGLAMGFFVLAWGAPFATPERPVSPVAGRDLLPAHRRRAVHLSRSVSRRSRSSRRSGVWVR